MRWLAVLGVLIFSFAVTAARATIYTVTFENVLLDDNPQYTVTGSFLFNATKVDDSSALYGLSDFNLLAVTPYGTFTPNVVGSVDSAFDYLGLGTSNSSSTPALLLVFSLTSNGNGTGLNMLSQSALNGQPLLLISNGQSDFIPGRSVAVPSIAELYGINYSGDGPGNWPAESNVFPTLSGSLVAAPVPEPSTWAMLLIGFAGIGFAGYRKRLRSPNRNAGCCSCW